MADESRSRAPFAALEPFSGANERLAANVHPAGWVNPEPRDRYHLVVVGGGTAGLVTAAIAVALGAKVALIERKLLGGDCLNVGCVPSKGMIEAARAWADARAASDGFGAPPTSGSGDFAAVMERVRRIRAEISDHDSAARFTGLGVDVFLGDASFSGPDRVVVGAAELRFLKAVIATGTHPAVPSILGLAEAGYLTNETVFTLTELPRRLVVVGGGPVGCELAQSFARFGSSVTLLEAGPRILARDDPDAAALVGRALARDGVEIHCRARIEEVESARGERTIRWAVDGERRTIAADEILMATGRAANIDALGLDLADVRTHAGGIEVDDHLRTANPRIYAIGDVASSLRFTHVADAHARMVVRNALFFGRGRVSSLVVPWCTYTTPELAHVGLSHDEIGGRGPEFDSVTVPLADVDRARLEGDQDGFLRIHLSRGSDRIVAATLVGNGAGEIISQLTQAMTAGVGLGKLAETIFPYPTRAEIVRKAADARGRERLTARLKNAFGLYFRVRR